MAKKSEKYSRKSEGLTLVYTIEGKEIAFNVPQAMVNEFAIEGFHAAIARRMLDVEWTENNLKSVVAMVESGERKTRETSQSSPLYVAAYKLFRRFAALNMSQPDPQVTDEQATLALDNMSENEFTLLKKNAIFAISYKKAKADQAENMLAAQMKALGL